MPSLIRQSGQRPFVSSASQLGHRSDVMAGALVRSIAACRPVYRLGHRKPSARCADLIDPVGDEESSSPTRLTTDDGDSPFGVEFDDVLVSEPSSRGFGAAEASGHAPGVNSLRSIRRPTPTEPDGRLWRTNHGASGAGLVAASGEEGDDAQPAHDHHQRRRLGHRHGVGSVGQPRRPDRSEDPKQFRRDVGDRRVLVQGELLSENPSTVSGIVQNR